MGTYQDWINELKEEFIGLTVTYKRKDYKVLDVNNDAQLIINMPSEDSDTNAVSRLEITVKEKNNGK